MVALKISSLFAVLGLVLCQMCSSQASPVRPGLESLPDRVTVSDYEARRLLNALVKEFVQMTAEEMEQESDGNSLDNRPMSKRCSGLSTCTLWKLSQDLHKLNSYPRTDVGVGTPGKKRSALGGPDSERYANYGEHFDPYVATQKRACNMATCVTHRLADFLSRSGGMAKNNFVPTNVGSKAFGRRRRSVHI